MDQRHQPQMAHVGAGELPGYQQGAIHMPQDAQGAPLGTYHPGMVSQAPMGTYHPGMVPQAPMNTAIVTPNSGSSVGFCPATPDGRHVVKKGYGLMGVLIGCTGCFFCLPCFLVTIPMDRKTTCTRCFHVLEPSWGNM